MQVIGFAQPGISHVDELLNFPFRNHIGGLGQHLHHPHIPHFHHHLERAGIQKIAHQHAGSVAKALVGRVTASAQGGFVHHVVVQQSGGVDELDHRRQCVPVGVVVPQCPTHQQEQRRPQTLAASRDDVLAHVPDQRNPRAEFCANDSVHGCHVLRNQGQRRRGGGGWRGQVECRQLSLDYKKPFDTVCEGPFGWTSTDGVLATVGVLKSRVRWKFVCRYH